MTRRLREFERGFFGVQLLGATQSKNDRIAKKNVFDIVLGWGASIQDRDIVFVLLAAGRYFTRAGQ